MLDLIDVRAFARIADLRSVSAAARALKAPKSSVSRSLARLEAAVGAVLVERSTRHLRLTDVGALFHPHALRILNDVDEAETALGSFAGVPRGTLRVNALYAFALALLAPMLPAFLARYPEVRVTLDVDNRQVDVLAEQADLMIRIGTLATSGLILTPRRPRWCSQAARASAVFRTSWHATRSLGASWCGCSPIWNRAAWRSTPFTQVTAACRPKYGSSSMRWWPTWPHHRP